MVARVTGDFTGNKGNHSNQGRLWILHPATPVRKKACIFYTDLTTLSVAKNVQH